MAYGTKYWAETTSPGGVTTRLELQRDGWATATTYRLNMTKNGLTVNYNCKDWFQPIIGSKCSFSLINDSDDFFEYTDLFGSDEFEWRVYVTASKGTTTIDLFDGFLNSEATESRYLKNSTMRFTASNYISKLKNVVPDIVENWGNANFISILQESLALTGKEDFIYANMTLEPSSNYSTGYNYPTLTRTGIGTDVFWKNETDKGGVTTIIESILKSFNSYIYWWNGRWYIERYNDLWPDAGTKNYQLYDPTNTYDYNTYVSRVSFYDVSLNLCDSDVKNINYSQQISIDPGIKRLFVEKTPKELSNLTTNKFDYKGAGSGPWVCSSTSNPLTTVDPELRKWSYYVDSSFIDNDAILSWPPIAGWATAYRGPEYPFSGIGNPIYRIGIPTDNDGYQDNSPLLSTKFQCTVHDGIVDPSNNVGGTSLSIKYKWRPNGSSSILSWPDRNYNYQHRWFIKDVSGTSKTYLGYDEEEDKWYETFSFGGHINSTYIGNVDEETGMANVEINIPLSDVSGNGAPYELGDKTYVFGILSEKYEIDGGEPRFAPYSAHYGDFVITVDNLRTPNVDVGTINLNTITETTVKLDVFDVSSLNTRSGIVTGPNFDHRTESWNEEGDDTYNLSLSEWLIKDRFKLYNKGRRKIETTLRYDSLSNPIKPLKRFVDNQDPSTRKYILTNYTFTPEKDEYKCEMWEYGEEENNLIT